MGTADLELAMDLLGVEGDPMLIMRDHPDARKRAELLAHIAAGVVGRLADAEATAELDVEDRIELHCRADAGTSADPLELQLARLAWVHHAVARCRGSHANPVADTVTTSVGAIVQLVEAWRVYGDPEQPDPMLADALLLMAGAANHLAGVLRWYRPMAHAARPSAGARSGKHVGPPLHSRAREEPA